RGLGWARGGLLRRRHQFGTFDRGEILYLIRELPSCSVQRLLVLRQGVEVIFCAKGAGGFSQRRQNVVKQIYISIQLERGRQRRRRGPHRRRHSRQRRHHGGAHRIGVRLGLAFAVAVSLPPT